MAEPPASLTCDAWLDSLAELLPGGAVGGLGAAERAILLDLARVAAHRSERIAAPLTTYLAGVAMAGRPPEERLAALRALLAALEAQPGPA